LNNQLAKKKHIQSQSKIANFKFSERKIVGVKKEKQLDTNAVYNFQNQSVNVPLIYL
jgi:hypothetical protein